VLKGNSVFLHIDASINPVKAFSSSSRCLSLFIFPSSVGTDPVRLLNCNHNCSISIRFPNSIGMDPVKLLYASESDAKVVMLPNHGYNGPDSPELPSAQNSLIAGDPSSGDKSPVKKLSVMYKYSRSGSSLSIAGILVLNIFPSKLR